MITINDCLLIQYLMGDDVFTDTKSTIEFSYISNPDKTLRWIYPKQLKSPCFLNFYSTASLRAKVMSILIRFAFFTKQSHRVKSGDIQLHISKSSRLGMVLNEYPHTGFSIYTGTVGENRKAVIEIHNERELFLFVKIALKESSKTLVNTEAKCLKYLNSIEFTFLVVPKLLINNKIDTIGLSNIKPNTFKQYSNLTNVHIQALSELYSKSSTHIKWTDLNALSEIKYKAKELLVNFEVVNDLEKSRVQEFANKILLFTNILEDKEDELTVAISHGDFTPWNMYSTNKILYLFDWELCLYEIPLLFDLFHFVFQSGIMIKHDNYSKIYAEISNVLKMQDVHKIIKKYNIDINKHYMFYMIYNISYYLTKYIKQVHLHKQVFWLINTWEDAVDDLLIKKGIVFH